MSNIHFQWNDRSSRNFRTGVSLHSHTLHSRESLDFIQRATKDTPWLSGAIRKQEIKYRAAKGRDLDLKRAWWTPPLSAHQAFDVEKAQIETSLDLAALVSLSDHDSIEAPLSLRVLDHMRDCPISVEWTVPFRETFFHIGVHNIPAATAREMMIAMEVFTKTPDEEQIAPLLEWFGAAPESLLILNHPAWDENHIGEGPHSECVAAFLRMHNHLVHAFELNGLRPWKENQKVIKLAQLWAQPVISGGDRHGREPNACLNLTNASCFAQFAEEVRRDRWSDVLLMPHYRESLKMRILENMVGILQDDPDHAMGWTRWSDRVFYQSDEGVAKSLTELWGDKFPSVVNRFVGLMSLVRHRRVRWALRTALNENTEFAL